MTTARDVRIMQMLYHFRVLNRRQLEQIIFPNLKSATPTANRVLKRLERDGYILQIPQPKDRPYLYMPNPARIHHQSSKLEHYLGLADLYIQYGQPEVFEVEPNICEEYRPDVYMVKDGKHIIIEYQRTFITAKKMQDKIDRFVASYNQGKHQCTTLWIVSGIEYRHIACPSHFNIIQKAPGA